MGSRLTAACGLAFAVGCAHARPSAGFAPEPSTGRAMLGAPLTYTATWADRCVDWGALFDNLVRTEVTARTFCDEKRFHVEVTCTPACELPDGASADVTGVASVRVIPSALGELTVRSRSTRPDTGEWYSWTTRTLQVVPPDKVELGCTRGNAVDQPCDEGGVDAKKPLVTVRPLLDDWPHVSDAVEVNGTRLPLPPLDRLQFSLADIFPDRRLGTGVEPGAYELDLTLGTYSSHLKLVAR